MRTFPKLLFFLELTKKLLVPAFLSLAEKIRILFLRIFAACFKIKALFRSHVDFQY